MGENAGVWSEGATGFVTIAMTHLKKSLKYRMALTGILEQKCKELLVHTVSLP